MLLVIEWPMSDRMKMDWYVYLVVSFSLGLNIIILISLIWLPKALDLFLGFNNEFIYLAKRRYRLIDAKYHR